MERRDDGQMIDDRRWKLLLLMLVNLFSSFHLTDKHSGSSGRRRTENMVEDRGVHPGPPGVDCLFGTRAGGPGVEVAASCITPAALSPLVPFFSFS